MVPFKDLSFKAVDPATRLDRIECLITEIFARGKAVSKPETGNGQQSIRSNR
jgi:hypothetical protein